MELRHLKWGGLLLPVVAFIALEFLYIAVLEPRLPVFWARVTALAALIAVAFTVGWWFTRRLEHVQRQAEQHRERLHALHEASLSLTAELSQEAILQEVVDLSRRLVRARYGALGVLDEDGNIQSLITSGMTREERARIGSLPQGRGLLGAVLQEKRPIRVADVQKDPRAVGFPPHHPPMKSFLGVPVVSKGRVLGNLYLADKENGGEFSAEDEELLTMFATQAAIAIENARLYAQVRTLATLAERERIAREMHDGLAQVLTYVNTKSLAVRELLHRGDLETAQTELEQLAETAREVYADVREAILGLRTTIGQGRSFFPALQGYLQRFTEQCGVQVELIITPSPEAFPFSPESEIQLLRIVQEALTNVRKHAHATRAWVRFVADGSWAIVTIEDNGHGFDPDRPRRSPWPCFGLQTMLERAEAVGGVLSVESRPGEGTRITARIPLTHPQA